MKKNRFTEDQILGFLKAAKAEPTVAELCRKHGFSDAAFYGWRKKRGRLGWSLRKPSVTMYRDAGFRSSTQPFTASSDRRSGMIDREIGSLPDETPVLAGVICLLSFKGSSRP